MLLLLSLAAGSGAASGERPVSLVGADLIPKTIAPMRPVWPSMAPRGHNNGLAELLLSRSSSSSSLLLLGPS